MARVESIRFFDWCDSSMEHLVTWLSGPWPWYVSGPIIGSLVPAMLFIGSKSFGISQNLEHLVAITQPEKVDVEFFRYDLKKYRWSIVFVIGVATGGFAAQFIFPAPGPVALSAAALETFSSWGLNQNEGLYPPELYGLGLKNLVVLAFGGILVGFGTRYASGCTSGHAITGLATLQLKSLTATIGIFAGGLLTAHFVTPFLVS